MPGRRMKNAAHRVAVSTRIKTVNGDKINAVGCDGKKEGRQLEARTRKVEGVRTNAPATPSLTHAGGMKRLREGWTMQP